MSMTISKIKKELKILIVYWNLEFGIWNLEFGIWNLEFDFY